MKTVKVSVDFYHRLANRDEKQGDGKHTAVEFRNKYLSELDNDASWENTNAFITFDFDGVKKIGPSFANEAIAYFTTYASKDKIQKKILFTNISKVQNSIINVELDSGYIRK